MLLDSSGTHDATTSLPGSALDDLVTVTGRIRTAVESVVTGRSDAVDVTLAVLLAGGHLLIEDVPGVGKTTLAKALARAVDGSVGRIQFTPDLLPSDLTGVSIYRSQTHEFEFRPGPVFSNVVIGDEINRASPKTQSALLECMEEGQTTVDGVTHALPRPFFVVATQNPVEMEGTYPLPEAQRDRFMARLSVGYPEPAAELQLLDRMETHDPLAEVTPVADVETVARLVSTVRGIWASDAVKQYVLALVSATREHPSLRLGASPRTTIQLLRASKAVAAMDQRDHVLPDDVQRLAVPVLAHRLITTTEARLAGQTPADVVAAIVERTAVPARADRSLDRR
ncbi:MAG TPA: MoxR family ATPase [Luteimicrobium sp.]|nr:MoxR family ATPase [Luteimicrobium sp.]